MELDAITAGLIVSNPTEDDSRLRLLPSWPEPPQHYPEQLIRSATPQLEMLLFQDNKLLAKNSELLAKSQVLQQEVAARAAGWKSQNEQRF